MHYLSGSLILHYKLGNYITVVKIAYTIILSPNSHKNKNKISNS